MTIGNQDWILRGLGVPFTLRPVSEGHYQLASEAYVTGIMFGEYMREPREWVKVEFF